MEEKVTADVLPRPFLAELHRAVFDLGFSVDQVMCILNLSLAMQRLSSTFDEYELLQRVGGILKVIEGEVKLKGIRW